MFLQSHFESLAPASLQWRCFPSRSMHSPAKMDGEEERKDGHYFSTCRSPPGARQPRETAQLEAPVYRTNPNRLCPPAANDRVSLATSLEHQRRRDAAEKEALSSISFQPWLLSNSCSLFIYFNISLVTQAAAHRLTLPAPSATHATLLYLAQHDAAGLQHGTG